MKYFSYFAGKEAMQAVYQTKLDTINAQASKEELKRLQAFFDSIDGDIYEKYEKFINYYMFHTPSLFEAKTYADNNQNVYMYYFTEESTIPELKSAHGFELRYVFGNLNDLAASEEPANPTLSAIMQKSFVNFAKTGNPSILGNQVEGISSLEWKKYIPDDYQVMILNSNNPHLESDPLNERNETIKDLMEYIRWEINVIKTKKETNELTDKELQRVSGGALEDSLKKLHEGTKTNSNSSDDGYQISDEIREKIRNGINPYQKA